MIILTIRTDKPEAEVGVYDGEVQLAYEQWLAHRQLAETIHAKIDKVLAGQQLELGKVQGIVCYKGPGSFTGLRIGMAVANALAYSLGIPVVSHGGEDWLRVGAARLQKGESEPVALPEYGAPAFTTQPRK